MKKIILAIFILFTLVPLAQANAGGYFNFSYSSYPTYNYGYNDPYNNYYNYTGYQNNYGYTGPIQLTWATPSYSGGCSYSCYTNYPTYNMPSYPCNQYGYRRGYTSSYSVCGGYYRY